MAELDAYDAVHPLRLGSNTLLLPPRCLAARQARAQPPQAPARLGGGRRRPDDDRRLLLASRASTVRARWRKTPVEQVLPVTCLPVDDRVEMPDGFAAELVEPEHPVLQGLGGGWPLLLGVNEVELKAREPAPGQAAGRGGRPSAAGRRHPRQGPHPRLDLRHRPALGPRRIRGLGWLCPSLASVSGLVDSDSVKARACLYRRRGTWASRSLPPIARSHSITTAPEVMARIEALALTHPAHG